MFSQDSSVPRGSIPDRDSCFPPRYHFQTGCGPHPASYQMITCSQWA